MDIKKIKFVKDLCLNIYKTTIYDNNTILDNKISISKYIDKILKSTYMENLCLNEILNMLTDEGKYYYCDVLKLIFMTQRNYLQKSITSLNKNLLNNSNLSNSENYLKEDILKEKLLNKTKKRNIILDDLYKDHNFENKGRENIDFKFNSKNKENKDVFNKNLIEQEKEINKKVEELFKKIENDDKKEWKLIKDPIILVKLNNKLANIILNEQINTDKNLNIMVEKINQINYENENNEFVKNNLKSVISNINERSNIFYNLKQNNFDPKIFNFENLEQNMKFQFKEGYNKIVDCLKKNLLKISKKDKKNVFVQTKESFENLKRKDIIYKNEISNLNRKINDLKKNNLKQSDIVNVLIYEKNQLKLKNGTLEKNYDKFQKNNILINKEIVYLKFENDKLEKQNSYLEKAIEKKQKLILQDSIELDKLTENFILIIKKSSSNLLPERMKSEKGIEYFKKISKNLLSVLGAFKNDDIKKEKKRKNSLFKKIMLFNKNVEIKKNFIQEEKLNKIQVLNEDEEILNDQSSKINSLLVKTDKLDKNSIFKKNKNKNNSIIKNNEIIDRNSLNKNRNNFEKNSFIHNLDSNEIHVLENSNVLKEKDNGFEKTKTRVQFKKLKKKISENFGKKIKEKLKKKEIRNNKILNLKKKTFKRKNTSERFSKKKLKRKNKSERFLEKNSFLQKSEQKILNFLNLKNKSKFIKKKKFVTIDNCNISEAQFCEKKNDEKILEENKEIHFYNKSEEKKSFCKEKKNSFEKFEKNTFENENEQFQKKQCSITKFNKKNNFEKNLKDKFGLQKIKEFKGNKKIKIKNFEKSKIKKLNDNLKKHHFCKDCLQKNLKITVKNKSTQIKNLIIEKKKDSRNSKKSLSTKTKNTNFKNLYFSNDYNKSNLKKIIFSKEKEILKKNSNQSKKNNKYKLSFRKNSKNKKNFRNLKNINYNQMIKNKKINVFPEKIKSFQKFCIFKNLKQNFNDFSRETFKDFSKEKKNKTFSEEKNKNLKLPKQIQKEFLEEKIDFFETPTKSINNYFKKRKYFSEKKNFNTINSIISKIKLLPNSKKSLMIKKLNNLEKKKIEKNQKKSNFQKKEKNKNQKSQRTKYLKNSKTFLKIQKKPFFLKNFNFEIKNSLQKNIFHKNRKNFFDPEFRKLNEIIYSYTVERKNYTFKNKPFLEKNYFLKINSENIKKQIIAKSGKLFEKNENLKIKIFEIVNKFNEMHISCFPNCKHLQHFIVSIDNYLKKKMKTEILHLPILKFERGF